MGGFEALYLIDDVGYWWLTAVSLTSGDETGCNGPRPMVRAINLSIDEAKIYRINFIHQ